MKGHRKDQGSSMGGVSASAARYRHAVSGLCVVFALAPLALAAQEKAAAKAESKTKMKGIWEPVNYPVDLSLNDVFFVTPDVGWVTGGVNGKGGGVILHTKDGGKNWKVQLGDPESTENAYNDLHFIDPTHGWAVQATGSGDHTLLRTTDGEQWEAAGTVPQHRGGYTFVSPMVGFATQGTEIHRTQDGGRTWQTVLECKAKAEVDGLTRDVTCHFRSIHFPTSSVGYAAGGCNGAPLAFCLAKTDNGGDSWTVSVIPAEQAAEEVVFTDANTGIVRIWGYKLYRTADGGKSWRPLTAKAPGAVKVKFADPQVGWSLAYRQIVYTTDGGQRWTSRELAFPAHVNAFSVPRRDRGYAVGDHGMVYRYRVIRASEPTPAKAFEAPAMPPAVASSTPR